MEILNGLRFETVVNEIFFSIYIIYVSWIYRSLHSFIQLVTTSLGVFAMKSTIIDHKVDL